MTSVASFGLELVDGISGPTKKAQASVASLKTKLEDTRESLKRYQLALVGANESGNVAGRQKTLDGIKKSESSIGSLTSKLGEMTSASGGAAGSLGGLGAAAGPVGMAISAMAVAATLAVAAVVALADATYKLTVFSLDTVNANDRMRTSFEALGGAGSGNKIIALVDELGEKLPQSRTELAGWTREIEKMGVTDIGEIKNELVATASAQAILGETGAASYEKISRKVHDAIDAHHALKITSKELTRTLGDNLAGVAAGKLGLTLGELEKKLKAGTVDAAQFGAALSVTLRERGSGPLEAMGNSLSTLREKAGEAFAHLFDGINTKPLTDALRGLIALGDQGAPSGQAIRAGLVPTMNTLIALFGSALHAAGIFFLKMEIGALRAYIAIQPLLSALKAIGSPILGALGTGTTDFAHGGVKGAAPSRTLIENTGQQKERVGTTTLDRHPSVRSISPNAFAAKAPPPVVVPQSIDKSHHVGSIVVNITAPDGVTDAQGISTAGLSAAVERWQLASGR